MWLPIMFSILILGSCQEDNETPTDGREIDREQLLQSGLNPDSVATALKNAEKLPNFYGLLVVKDGEVVVEEYFKGKTKDDHYHLRSITKNFTSALTGIAIHEGLLDSLDMSITSHFSELDPSKDAVTVRHLLNMSSGLQWDETNEVIPLIEHQIQVPVTNYLSRSMVDAPGSTFNYSSVSPHVVAAMISERTNSTLKAYAQSKLLESLAIDDIKWEKDPQGNEWGGFGLQLLPEDLVKFGQVYLNGGVWEGEQIVPASWIQISQSSQIALPGGNTGYSLQWYVTDNIKYKVYYGQGFGGQGLLLIPEKSMMIISLQEYLVSFQQSGVQWRGFLEDVFNPIFLGLD